MKNYIPLIVTQILNIKLYTLFRVKGKDINNHGNQTYYFSYDGLHNNNDEINVNLELQNKILTGKAEIIYPKNPQKIPQNINTNDIEINAIVNRFKLGDLTLAEWKFVYYLITKNNSKNEKQIIDFEEFEYLYHYQSNTITKEKQILNSLLEKQILIDYKNKGNRKNEITFSNKLLDNIRKTGYKYKLKSIIDFKCKATFPFYDYLIYQLKNENFETVELTLKEFKKTCSLSNKNYLRYSSLKNKVINPVMNDINDSLSKNKYGLRVYLEEIKDNQKVIGLKINIIRKEKL